MLSFEFLFLNFKCLLKMLWNLTMEKSELNETENDISKILEEKYKDNTIVKYNTYFHLNKKDIFYSHNQYMCTYILQNETNSNIYLALKNNSSGEGYIFNKENNLYIKSHSQLISKLIIDYKNNYIISCSYDKIINIYDLSKFNNNSKILSALKGHKGRIYDMDLIPNKDQLLSCGMDKNILLWDIKNFTLIKNIYLISNVHNLVVRYLITEELKELIFVYSKNQTINFIDLKNFEIIEKNNICNNANSVLILNNKEYIYQNKKSHDIIIYDFIMKKEKSILKGCKNNIQIINKSKKSDKIISYDNGNNIKIWNYIKQFCELTIKIDFVLYCFFLDIEGNLICGSINKTYIYN